MNFLSKNGIFCYITNFYVGVFGSFLRIVNSELFGFNYVYRIAFFYKIQMDS
jgi:hypothetical protein